MGISQHTHKKEREREQYNQLEQSMQYTDTQ